jgi:hypothetical protein
MHIFSVRRIKMFVKEMRPQYLDSDKQNAHLLTDTRSKFELT